MIFVRFQAVTATTVPFIMSGLVLTLCDRTFAQNRIQPDNSLGKENSKVTARLDRPNFDVINGGAQRGTSLFHSFNEFNVGEGSGVTFANPSGVNNIFSRVIGPLKTDILGELGVGGQANLFILNPNGIYFGPKAKLNIAGSFLVSSAAALDFGNGVEFRADASEVPSLLTMKVPIGVQYGPGAIVSEGSLHTGQDFILSSDRLEIGGEVSAGQNLTLRSLNPILSEARFLAGQDFKVEGIDGTYGQLESPNGQAIFAGRNIELGDYEGGSLHILAGGNARLGDIQIVETGTESATINSNNLDKVNESLTFADLASLEIEDFELQRDGQGRLKQVPIQRTITISGSEKATLDVRTGVDWNTLGGFFSQSQISGDVSLPNNGNQTASIVLERARIDKPEGQVLLTNRFKSNQALENGAIVSNIIDTSVYGNEQGGDVFILGHGDITSPMIDTSSTVTQDKDNRVIVDKPSGDGGDILISSITGKINNGYVYSYSMGNEGNGGKIEISSVSGSIDNQSLNSGAFTRYGNTGRGESITITSVSGNIENKTLQTSTFSRDQDSGHAGNITISSISGNIENEDLRSFSTSLSGNSNRGGDITISSQTGNIENKVIRVVSSSRSRDSSRGGNITIFSSAGNIENHDLQSTSSSRSGNSSRGGNITISSETGIINNYELRAASSSMSGNSGRGGDIIISSETGNIDNKKLLRSSSTSVSGNSGRGGNIIISSETGNIDNRIIDNKTDDDIENDDTVLQSQSFSRYGNSGQGGNITISSKAGNIKNQNILRSVSSASSGNSGRSGDITISSISGNIDNQFLRSVSIAKENSGQGGNIMVSSETGNISNQNIQSGSFSNYGSSARGGNITILSRAGNINNKDLRSTSTARSGDSGIGGNITISSMTGNINNQFLRSASVSLANDHSTKGNSARGGDIKVSSRTGHIQFEGNIEAFSYSELGKAGKSGNITINTQNKSLIGITQDDEQPKFLAFSIGKESGGIGGNISLIGNSASNLELLTLSSSQKSGNVTIQGKSKSLLIQNVNIIASAEVNLKISSPLEDISDSINIDTSKIGDSGNVTISSPGNTRLENVIIESNSNGRLPAGDLKFTTSDLMLKNSKLSTNANNVGRAGNLILNANSLLLDNSQITATANEQLIDNTSEQGNININVNSLLLLKNNSRISTRGFQDANGGNIKVNRPLQPAKLVIGFPSNSSGNDIIANAFEGKGGNITINSEHIFGFTRSQPRDGNKTNDINASSRTNLQGTVNINSVDVQPDDNKPPLPNSFNPPLVRNTCNPGSQNSFVSVSQGGKKPNLKDITIQLWDDSRSVSSQNQSITSPDHTQLSPQIPTISEAQGWSQDAKGNIQLIASHSSPAIAANTSSCKTAQNP